eukprot:CAMPEP_0116844004 /NCGR_PEP_ID=MMETSP0418-20121206/12418_1 /TAXON_ID=1158023 /ORGANISM="Astrosyne radiata, Strain 13vi08-1A" /LENGTH=256 /DNA_ID=CAMNT_0004474851 /DNA_START=126 /DNA_END=896 /DNA_ORIENTATION=+
MPRGFVHEAFTDTCNDDNTADDSSHSFSYHVTIALATHDWTLAGMLTNATQHTLSRIIEYRMAMSMDLTSLDHPKNHRMARKQLETTLQNVWKELQNSITVDRIIENLQYKYERHNQGVLPMRMECIQKAASASSNPQNQSQTLSSSNWTGREASRLVTLDTIVHAVSEPPPPSKQQRGLFVRESSSEGLLGILQCLRKDPTKQYVVSRLIDLLPDKNKKNIAIFCPLTLLSFVKCAVEMGALAIVAKQQQQQTNE